MSESSIQGCEQHAKSRSCDYCGAKPAYEVVWGYGSERTIVYLCEKCDREEIEYLQREDEGDDTE